jgi:hypothetical protein
VCMCVCVCVCVCVVVPVMYTRSFCLHALSCVLTVRRVSLVQACALCLLAQLSVEGGSLSIPVTADVLSAMEFSNAIARFTKPKSDDELVPEIDPAFAAFLVPSQQTHPLVVPVLPLMAPS